MFRVYGLMVRAQGLRAKEFYLSPQLPTVVWIIPTDYRVVATTLTAFGLQVGPGLRIMACGLGFGKVASR